MATIFSSPAAAAAAASSAAKPQAAPPLLKPSRPLLSSVAATLAAAAASTVVLTAAAAPPCVAEVGYSIYYGTASSAANYGGFGGNSSKKDAAEYVYDVPEGWKEKVVTKVEKGTNGTDSEFYSPRNRSEREYLTSLDGCRELAPADAILNSLALSDVGLQDLISGADRVRSEERKDGKGQVYYTYEIQGGGGDHCLISVTCARNKLYAHFVNAPPREWGGDREILRHLHESFRTVSF